MEKRDARGEGVRLKADEVLRPGDEIRILLRKTSKQIFDVNIFYLDANFRVQPLFPKLGELPRLTSEADKTLTLTDWLSVVDDGLGLEHLLVFATPRTE